MGAAQAQIATDSELYQTLKAKDSVLFEEVFNKCHFNLLHDLIDPNLEFFHDQGGLQNYDQFVKAVKENICSNPEVKPIRKLVEGSLSVFPLYDEGKLYGAIQMGVHDFYLQRPEMPLQFTSEAKFIHTWLLEEGTWKLYTVLSFDHVSKNKNQNTVKKLLLQHYGALS